MKIGVNHDVHVFINGSAHYSSELALSIELLDIAPPAGETDPKRCSCYDDFNISLTNLDSSIWKKTQRFFSHFSDLFLDLFKETIAIEWRINFSLVFSIIFYVQTSCDGNALIR